MLEIPKSFGMKSSLIPIVKSDNGNYFQATKAHIFELAEALWSWTQLNSSLTEVEYKKILKTKKHGPSRISIKNDISSNNIQNLDENVSTILIDSMNTVNTNQTSNFQSESDWSLTNQLLNALDSQTIQPHTPKLLYLADNTGNLLEWDIEQEKITKTKQVDSTEIRSIAQTESGYQFTSNIEGNLVRWSIPDMQQIKNYGNIHKDSIWSIAISTKFSDILFTSDQSGTQKWWAIPDLKYLKEFKEIHKFCIKKIIASLDGKWLFSSDEGGHLQQFCIKTQALEFNYKKIYEPLDGIASMAITSDSENQFIGGFQELKVISISKKKEKIRFSYAHFGIIQAMAVTKNNEFLFTTDDNGFQKQWCISKLELLYDFGQIHKSEINSIALSTDEFLFTIDENGQINQWNIKSKKLHKQFGKIYHGSILASISTL